MFLMHLQIMPKHDPDHWMRSSNILAYSPQVIWSIVTAESGRSDELPSELAGLMEYRAYIGEKA